MIELFQHVGQHWDDLVIGAATWAAIGHMVNTCPTPKNVWLQWVLGGVKFMVGQRISAMNAINGLQTATVAVTNEQKDALKNGSSLRIVETEHDVENPAGEATGRFKPPSTK